LFVEQMYKLAIGQQIICMAKRICTASLGVI